jgi:hypothetical protein
MGVVAVRRREGCGVYVSSSAKRYNQNSFKLRKLLSHASQLVLDEHSTSHHD